MITEREKLVSVLIFLEIVLQSCSAALFHRYGCLPVNNCLSNFDCQNSELGNDELSSILLSLPQNTTSLKIDGQKGRRNYFAISQDLGRFPELQKLWLRHGSIQTLGTNVFSAFSKLRLLDVSNNFVSHLTPQTFENTRSLETLILDNNKVGHSGLPSGTFGYLQNLDTLSLAANGLQTLPHNVLQGLRNVTHLNLAKNSLDSYINDDLLSHCPYLKKLNLHQCKIRNLSSNVFSSSKYLKDLNLSGNKFDEVPHAALLPIAAQLKALDLSKNQITTIHERAFTDWSVIAMDLGFNRLGGKNSGLSRHAFLGSTIKNISLANNKLEYSHLKCLLPLRYHLETLDLSRNPLYYIDEAFFHRFYSLQVLILADTGIATWPRYLPRGFSSLRVLVLSGNHLQKLNPAHLDQMRNLEQLDISHNRIKNINPHDVSQLRRIPQVIISQNLWHCDCHTHVLLEYLNFQNATKTIQSMEDFSCFTPENLKGELVTNLHEEDINGCSIVLGAVGLIDKSDVGIVVAATCAIFLIVILILAVLFSYFWPKLRGVSTPKTNISAATSENSDIGVALTQESSVPGLASAKKGQKSFYQSNTFIVDDM